MGFLAASGILNRTHVRIMHGQDNIPHRSVLRRSLGLEETTSAAEVRGKN
jgi:hypothetical protein